MFSFIFNTKKTQVFALLLLFLITITNCTKDADNLTFVSASIDDISPNSGPGDAEVTITGISFNTDIDGVSVFFNNVEAEVTSITQTEIKAIVPRGAQSGIVKLVISGGEEVLGPEFTYIITPAQVITIAGSEMTGDVVGPISEALFSSPWGIVIDKDDNIYIADSNNNKIKKISTDGIVSTVAGTGEAGFLDGPLDQAILGGPRGMALDIDGNIIFTDVDSHSIRKLNLNGTGEVTTIAGTGEAGLVNGDGSIAQFAFPIGVVVDANNTIYVVELPNSTIRKITPNNAVSTLTGNGMSGSVDGPPDVAQVGFPANLTIDNDGNIIFADAGNNNIRKVTPQGVVSTIAGTGIAGDTDGAASIAQFNIPFDVEVDAVGNIYVVGFDSNKIKRIDTDNIVTTYAGTGELGSKDGVPSIATFNRARNLAMDSKGDLYVVTENSIRKINPEF